MKTYPLQHKPKIAHNSLIEFPIKSKKKYFITKKGPNENME